MRCLRMNAIHVCADMSSTKSFWICCDVLCTFAWSFFKTASSLLLSVQKWMQTSSRSAQEVTNAQSCNRMHSQCSCSSSSRVQIWTVDSITKLIGITKSSAQKVTGAKSWDQLHSECRCSIFPQDSSSSVDSPTMKRNDRILHNPTLVGADLKGHWTSVWRDWFPSWCRDLQECMGLCRERGILHSLLFDVVSAGMRGTVLRKGDTTSLFRLVGFNVKSTTGTIRLIMKVWKRMGFCLQSMTSILSI